MRNLCSLMLLISFGSVCAVAITPALPEIATYFKLSAANTESIISWYLIGYAFGQLIYGPLVNYLGSRKTIIAATSVSIFATILSILAGMTHLFILLLIARIIMALSAGAGLTLSFLINAQLTTKEQQAKTINLLIVAFAITPSFSTFIVGLLLNYFNWYSVYYFILAYSLLILIIAFVLPDCKKTSNTFQLGKLVHNYIILIRSAKLVTGALILGCCTTLIYCFAALAPFIAINNMHITTTEYGLYNLIPMCGLIIGPLLANYLQHKKLSTLFIITSGLAISILGSLLLLYSLNTAMLPLYLFLPMLIIYLGSALIFGNCSNLALAASNDKANASALMNCINLSFALLILEIIKWINWQGPSALASIFLIVLIFASIILIKLAKSAPKFN